MSHPSSQSEEEQSSSYSLCQGALIRRSRDPRMLLLNFNPLPTAVRIKLSYKMRSCFRAHTLTLNQFNMRFDLDIHASLVETSSNYLVIDIQGIHDIG